MLKKAVCILAACVVGLGLFCGCGDNTPAGTFYTLQEAYDKGYLTQEDLMSIAYYNNGGRGGNEEIMAEDYAPLPKTPEVLSEEIQRGIKQTFLNESFMEIILEDIPLDKIEINYLGSYNHCVAVRMVKAGAYFDVVVNSEVEGIRIFYSSVYSILDDHIRVWIPD